MEKWLYISLLLIKHNAAIALIIRYFVYALYLFSPQLRETSVEASWLRQGVKHAKEVHLHCLYLTATKTGRFQ